MGSLSGCTLARNAVKLNYPLEASILSYLPVCDEVVLAYDPQSEDATEAFVKDLARRHPQVRLVPSRWDMSNHVKGSEITIQSNVAIEACRSEWILYVQADEAVHDDDFSRIRALLDKRECLAGLFERRSFLHRLDREIASHHVTGLLRLFRNGIAYAVGDAMTCRLVQGAAGSIVNAPFRLFNYSRMGDAQEVLARSRSLHGFYHTDGAAIEEQLREESSVEARAFSIAAHPSTMRAQYAPLRLGVVTTWAVPCGIAKYSESLVGALKTTGTNVTILAEAVDASTGEGVADKSVVRCWRRGEALDELLDAIRSRDVDVANIQYHPAFFRESDLAWFLWRLKDAGVPATLTVHEVAPVVPSAVFLIPDDIIVHTSICAEALRSMGVGAEIAVMPLGVAPPVTNPSRRKTGQPILLSWGFMHPSKGFDFIIEALPLLRNEFPELRYQIVGSRHASAPAYAEALHGKAHKLGVADMVRIEEKYASDEHISSICRDADVVLYPYAHDTLGASGAVTQALSTGSAVITSRAPYFADLGDAVLRAGSPTEWAQAIGTVLRDPTLAGSLREKAARLARQRSWTVIAPAHVGTLREVAVRNAYGRHRRIRPWVSVHVVSKETDALGAALFQSCLASLRGYADELIVVDNGSSPKVLTMIESELRGFNGRIISRPDLGTFSDLRNVAIDATDPRATHVHWVDTDEVYFPDHLALLRNALRDNGISTFNTVRVHFMIDPTWIEAREVKRSVFRHHSGLRWTKAVHETVEGLAPGRAAFVPAEYLHFGYCRPQWQTFLKWLNYAWLEDGHIGRYVEETVNGNRLPWLRDARTPDTILDERRPRLHPYRGPYPGSCMGWLEAWRRSGQGWKEHLRSLVDHTLWDGWQESRRRTGSWQSALPAIVAQVVRPQRNARS